MQEDYEDGPSRKYCQGCISGISHFIDNGENSVIILIACAGLAALSLHLAVAWHVIWTPKEWIEFYEILDIRPLLIGKLPELHYTVQ
jgi:hypothetical protein